MMQTLSSARPCGPFDHFKCPCISLLLQTTFLLTHLSKVVMCKFHSVFLSADGRVFTCGHGRGGRLGHGNEETILVN